MILYLIVYVFGDLSQKKNFPINSDYVNGMGYYYRNKRMLLMTFGNINFIIFERFSGDVSHHIWFECTKMFSGNSNMSYVIRDGGFIGIKLVKCSIGKYWRLEYNMRKINIRGTVGKRYLLCKDAIEVGTKQS